jgi:Dolichyl-phosphate-mannose-protein mannosyltransferase
MAPRPPPAGIAGHTRDLHQEPYNGFVAPAEQAYKGSEPATGVKTINGLRDAARAAAIFLALLCLTLSLTYWSGAFRSELTAESDEAAHYITGLMVHDYLAHGIGQPPMAYAANYYLHYPKVALGHWPPVFYIMQAAWGFICAPSRNSMLGLMAICTTLIAFTLYRLVAREFRTSIGGAAAGALFLCIPLIQTYSSMVMADLIVAMFSWWALCKWTRYLESERARDALWFALAATAAILTKGNGFAVTLMAPLSLVLLRRFRTFFQPAFWMAAAVIAIVCVPWTIATQSLITPAMQFEAGAAFFLEANLYYAPALFQAVGAGIAIFAVIGVVVKVILPFLRKTVEPLWASALSLMVAVHVFHTLVPASIDDRFLLPSIAPALLFMSAGIHWTALRIHSRLPVAARVAALAGIVAIAFFAWTFHIPRKRHIGLDEAARDVASSPTERNTVILCSSNANGEGGFISELAMREPRPTHIVLRASLMLATSDWNGRDYKLLKSTPEEVNAFLTSIPVGLVVLDRSPGFAHWQHQDLLDQVMRGPDWQLVKSYPEGGGAKPGQVQVYRFTGSHALRARIHVDMADKPGRPHIVIDD